MIKFLNFTIGFGFTLIILSLLSFFTMITLQSYRIVPYNWLYIILPFFCLLVMCIITGVLCLIRGEIK